MGDKENVAAESKGPREISPNVAFLAFIVLALGYNLIVANLNSDGNSNTDRASAVASDYDDDSSAAAGAGTEQTTTTARSSGNVDSTFMLDNNLPGVMGADGYVTLPDGQKGKYYPPNLIFYPLVPSPPDLPEYTCFGIPDIAEQPLDPKVDLSKLEAPRVATTYATQAIAGLDSRILNDVYRYGIFYKNGVKYVIDLQTDPKGWSGLWLVKKGDFGCTRSN